MLAFNSVSLSLIDRASTIPPSVHFDRLSDLPALRYNYCLLFNIAVYLIELKQYRY